MERAISNRRPFAEPPLNCVDVWEPLEKRTKFIDQAINGSFEKNIFYIIHEWGIEHHLSAVGWTLESFNDALTKNNKFVDIVESSYSSIPNTEYSNIRVHKFPIWFLVESAVSRWQTLNPTNQYLDPRNMDIHLLDKTDFTYNFCSLSNKPHPHRCLLMDLLAKHNLIHSGAISFRENCADYRTHYTFTYYDGKTRLLSDCLDPNIFPNYNEVAQEVESSFIQLVSESTFEQVFLTEKTALRTLNYKPFIVSAAPGFYKLMDDLGYMRYDELFDYSFDTVVDDVQRTEHVVKNVLKFANLSRDQKLEAIETIKPKLIHNFNTTLRHAFDIKSWHPLVLEPIKYYQQTGISLCDPVVHPYIEVKRIKDFYKL